MVEFLACSDCGAPTGQAAIPGRPRPPGPGTCDDCHEAYLSAYAPLCDFIPSKEELFPPKPWPHPAEMMSPAAFAVFERELAKADEEDNDDDDECFH